MTQPLPDPASDAAAHPAEHAQHYQRVLHELIDIGVGFVRQLADAQAPGDVVTPEAAATYDRITRSIRRSIGLAQRLGEGAPVRATAPAARDPIAVRRRIIRDVEDVIQREAWGHEADDLRAELQERMDGPDVADDIDGRPAAEIIADICRDLGLGAMTGTHPWARRTPDDIAVLCARASGTWDGGLAAMAGLAPEAAAPGMGIGTGPPDPYPSPLSGSPAFR